MELVNPISHWWLVSYTLLAKNTAAFIFLELYDSCGLCALSHYMSANIRRLNVGLVLGTSGNTSERWQFIDVIESLQFREMESKESARGMFSI